jgi:hypothetical protein
VWKREALAKKRSKKVEVDENFSAVARCKKDLVVDARGMAANTAIKSIAHAPCVEPRKGGRSMATCCGLGFQKSLAVSFLWDEKRPGRDERLQGLQPALPAGQRLASRSWNHQSRRKKFLHGKESRQINHLLSFHLQILRKLNCSGFCSWVCILHEIVIRKWHQWTVRNHACGMHPHRNKNVPMQTDVLQNGWNTNCGWSQVTNEIACRENPDAQLGRRWLQVIVPLTPKRRINK